MDGGRGRKHRFPFDNEGQPEEAKRRKTVPEDCSITTEQEHSQSTSDRAPHGASDACRSHPGMDHVQEGSSADSSKAEDVRVERQIVCEEMQAEVATISGASEGKGFQIKVIREKRFDKFNTNQVTLSATVNDNAALSDIDNIMSLQHEMFQDMIDYAGKNLKDNDLMRICINSDSLERPISTQMIAKKYMTSEAVLLEVERVMVSNKDFVLDQSFFVDLVSVQFPEAGSGRSKGSAFHPNINNFLRNKRCIIQIAKRNEDELCAGRALVVARAQLQKKDNPKDWDRIRQGRALQKKLAKELYESAGVDKGPCGLPEIRKFQDLLSQYQIIVVDQKLMNQIIFKGPDRDQKLVLYLVDGHYHVITSMAAFAERSYFCYSCNVGYDHKEKHRCENICWACEKPGCHETDQWRYCEDCNRNFRSPKCYENHKIPTGRGKGPQRSVCDKKFRCKKCLKMEFREGHECFKRKCTHCGKKVDSDHLCFMQKVKRNDEEADANRKEATIREAKRLKTSETGTADLGTDDKKDTCDNDHNASTLQRIQLESGETVFAAIIETKQDFERYFWRKKENGEKKGDRVKEEQGDEEEHEDEESEEEKIEEQEEGEAEEEKDEAGEEKSKKGHNGKRAMSSRIITFDFECEQSRGKHEPICCVAKPEDENQVYVFRGRNTCHLFCQWAFDSRQRNTTFVAHNFKGYDGHFIVKYLIDNAVKPKIIYSGAKVMYLYIPRLQIKFIDSFNFLPMALSKFPQTFGFDDICKGNFPHLFSSLQNLDYRGELPGLQYYGVNYMSPEKRKECIAFHAKKVEEKYMFDFTSEMTKYCITDVLVLERGLLRFRDTFMRVTKGINPLKQSITIAAACNLVFRTNFLRENTIGIVPPRGYRHREHQSREAVDWLEFVAFRDGIYIQHAKNKGEKIVCGRKVDGFYTHTNTVYDYHGCFYHGCKKCYEPWLMNSVTKTKMGHLYGDTLRKKWIIENNGYRYIEMWSHDFHKIREQDATYQKYKRVACRTTETPSEKDGVEFLNPRDAFYGGRTNASCLYAKADKSAGETIEYVDFTSLYPYINKYSKYPVGHPVVILDDFKDLSDYFGIVKCKVLPPKQLLHPVLPDRIGGKLLFHLCKTCAVNRQRLPCRHPDYQRAFLGTWTTIELEEARQNGYRILQMYEVHHFEHSSSHLFQEYIDCWLKLKQEASGWPRWVENAQDRRAAEDQYLSEYEEKEGIVLDRIKIEVNPGMRALAKLMLNSFWGKFGQRNNLPKTEFVTSTERFFQILGSTMYDTHDVNIINEHVAEVRYTHKQDFVPETSNTNVYLAAFTTSMARLKLYKSLSQLGKAVLYYDTDSIIYKCNGENKLPLGDYLGEFKNEVENQGGYITEFCSGGPKNYSYITADGTSVTKVRGFTLNFKNRGLINFNVMRDMVLGKGPETVEIVDEHKITRNRQTKEVVSKEQVKRYRLVYDKRVVLADYTTLPYGYRP